jgi:hypothetical protein
MAQIWIIANSHQKQGVAGKAKKKKKVVHTQQTFTME